MKFRFSLANILICMYFVACIGSVHADDYSFYGSDVVVQVSQKLQSIQQEYQKLSHQKNLQYFWNASPKVEKLSFYFSEIHIASTEKLNQQTDVRFPFLEPKFRARIKMFIAVLMSEDFLRMLLGEEVFKKFLNGLDEDHTKEFRKFFKLCESVQVEESAFIKLDVLNDENGILKIRFWLRHAAVTGEYACECNRALLNLVPIFNYDINNNTVQFVGFELTPIVDVQRVKDVTFPIYSTSYSNSSVPQNNSMDID